MGIEETEFRRLLNLFPVIRPRDFHFESESSRQQSSGSGQKEELPNVKKTCGEGSGKNLEIQESEHHDAFWAKLRTAAERKVGAAEAERFCKAFQRVHNKLVREDLSPEAARNFVSSQTM